MSLGYLTLASFFLATAMLNPSTSSLKSLDDAQDIRNPVGTWRGQSICVSKNSGCHDEEVIYRITREKDSNKYNVDADRIVDGKAINMGPLVFSFDPTTATLSNETGKNQWTFALQENRMDGTLTRDNEVFRKITLVKQL
jgi:hypothetical protein